MSEQSAPKKPALTRKLQIGHVNICHLQNKVHDVCALLNNDRSSCIHILGLSETHPPKDINKNILKIPGYFFIKRKPKAPGHHGMGMYIHDSVWPLIKRRKDLESKDVECMWIEFRPNVAARPVLIGYVYRNPKSPVLSWSDDFVHMMDRVNQLQSDIVLQGDFNLNVLNTTPLHWKSTCSILGLHQLISEPTRVATSSSTLIDHIYTNNTFKIFDANLFFT